MAYVLRWYCCQTPRHTNTFQLKGLCFLYFVLLAYFFVRYGELLLQDAASLQGNTKSLPHLHGKYSHPFVSLLQSIAHMYKASAMTQKRRGRTFSSRALWCSKSDFRALRTSTSLETPAGDCACLFTTVILKLRSCRDTRHSRCSSKS